MYSASFKNPFSSLIKVAISAEVSAFPEIWRPSLDKICILLAIDAELLIGNKDGENVFPPDKIDPEVISEIDEAMVKVPLAPDAYIP